MNKPLLIGVVVVVVVAVALALALTRHASAIIINAPYAFIVRLGNGSWVVEYFDQSGNMHVVGQYSNLNDPDILNAMNVVDSFNQQVVPQHSCYQPLASIIVVGANDAGKQGIVEIPVSGNMIKLKDVDPRYYTLVTVPQQYANLFMEALATGYKLSAGVGANGLQYLQYNDPQIWKLILETGDLHQYVGPYPDFIGGMILKTNNNILIPYGYLSGTSSVGYASNLPFIAQAGTYNGS
mgnify:FL=1